MVLYINCANHVPGVKFGHAPGVDSLHRPTIGKTKKIFSETTRPTALIFGINLLKLIKLCFCLYPVTNVCS